MKKTKFIILGLAIIFALSLFTANIVLAEEADLTQDELAASLNEAQALATDELENLDGVEIDKPTKIPGTFGLWWRGVKESLSLVVTFNPIKKAEKHLRFAEERVRLANFIAETSEDPKAQEKAVAIIARANKFMEKIQARSEDFLEKINERTEKLLANVARHELNKEKVLDKLEDKVSLERIPDLQKMKDTIAEKTRIFLEKIAGNENIPEEVRTKIIIRKEAIAVRQEARVELREASKELFEKALAGDEEAKIEVKAKREETREKRKEIIEEFKDKTRGLINKARENAPELRKAMQELDRIKTRALRTIEREVDDTGTRIELRQRIIEAEPAIPGKIIQVPDIREGDGPAELEPVETKDQIIDDKLINQGDSGQIIEIKDKELIREPIRVEIGSGQVEPIEPTTKLDEVE